LKYAYIEITDACSLRCSFCPSSRLAGERHFMSEELFAQALRAARGCIQEIYLHVLGEPLLHPRFAQFLAMAEAESLPVNITTNGTEIGRQAETLLKAPSVRQINFSLHAYAELPESEARQKLAAVFDFAERALKERPELYLNFRLWDIGVQTSCPWNEFVYNAIAERFGASIDPARFSPRHKSEPVCGKLYVHSDSRFIWPGESAGEERGEGTCRALDTHCGVLVDGRVVACCLDPQGVLTLGDIRENTLCEILETPRAKAMKDGFAHGKLTEPFCRKCPYCRRFKRTGR